MTPVTKAFEAWKKTPDYSEAMNVDLKKMRREQLEAMAFAAFVGGYQAKKP